MGRQNATPEWRENLKQNISFTLLSPPVEIDILPPQFQPKPWIPNDNRANFRFKKWENPLAKLFYPHTFQKNKIDLNQVQQSKTRDFVNNDPNNPRANQRLKIGKINQKSPLSNKKYGRILAQGEAKRQSETAGLQQVREKRRFRKIGENVSMGRDSLHGIQRSKIGKFLRGENIEDGK